MLARLYSDDRGTAINGGEMPFTGRGYLDPAFANVAFNLQDPNKVSKIVESEYGFHIIQLMEKRGDRIKVRHILLKPHVPEEALMAGTARLDSIADDIRNGKFTLKKLLPYFHRIRIHVTITVCYLTLKPIRQSLRCRNFRPRLLKWWIR